MIHSKFITATTWWFYFSVMVLLGGLISCANSEQSNSKKVAEARNDEKFDKASERDAQVLVDAYSHNLYSVRVADTAREYAATQEAMNLAETVRQAHLAGNDQIKLLAIKKMITLPLDVTPDELNKLSKMRNDKKISFDQEFTETMVAEYKDAISLYEKAIAAVSDSDIKSWLSTTLPELRKHQELAIGIHDKLKKIK